MFSINSTLTWSIVICLLLLLGFYAGLYWNRIHWHSRIANSISGWIRIYCYVFHGLKHETITLPQSGAAIVVCNHISGLDPLLLIATVNRPLRFMIAREEYERFGLTWLFDKAGCIPVDRGSRPERAMKHALKALQQGEAIAMFPHGKIIPRKDTRHAIKAGAIRLAQKADCAIIPMHLSGVAGKGFTLLALLLPSRARLKVYPKFKCPDESYEKCLQKLADILNGENND
ncbi:MAG: 1-acyl-sn-glycerol-3-phosphate acyltransferase [Gammaproteobacteria bacterium]|nr:1-acyl-sn-glycerol-3-phosphate acyltransferase [Gammaproteobacteria bacterium]MDH5729021.1 1-acyl-sn-glycerol-3-phosphate acyltransferase [Gammaproteobacteria bacterium]